ncbi:MAG: hypothetical protein ACE5JB_01285 [bacterium]
MGQRELLLTIGAIIIFSISSFSVNQLALRNSEAIYMQQAEFYAVKLAQQFIEEAKIKAFDETTIVGNPVSIPSDFKSIPMGPEGGETYPNFDDVDDFNGFSTSIATNIGAMTISLSVDYVNETDLDSVVTTQTFYKKMSVTVQSDYLTNLVTAHYVFAYQKNP